MVSGSIVTMMFCAQIQSLNQKIIELKGIKRPNLKRVKKTADDMLGAYSDTSKLMKADFKVNLKTVKKEDDKVNMQRRSSLLYNKYLVSKRVYNLLYITFTERRSDWLA